MLADICDLKTLAEVVGPDKDKIEGARSDRQGFIASNSSADRDQGCRDGDRAIGLFSQGQVSHDDSSKDASSAMSQISKSNINSNS